MDIQNRILGEVYFVTDTVVDWVDIFTRPTYKHIILDSLAYCQKEKGLLIYAWVLMSNHLHTIAGSDGRNVFSDIWRDFKKFTSKEILRTLINDAQESRQKWMLNRFEYAGKNDKKITNYKFWQEGNDAQGIYLNDYFNQKLNYIHQNPVKAELVNRAEDYRYSSAIDYAGGKGLLDVVVV
ncbi:MAG: transposase [Bacteroidales bacterium]|nr:transposase [Bacteroidales bacterium]